MKRVRCTDIPFKRHGSCNLHSALTACFSLKDPLLRPYVPAGGEAGPSNIEESKADRKRSKSSGVPSRPLPVSVCKDVIMSLAKQQGWKGWAFDGRKNIYTSTALMDTHQEHKFQVCFGRPTCADATRGPHVPARELLYPRPDLQGSPGPAAWARNPSAHWVVPSCLHHRMLHMVVVYILFIVLQCSFAAAQQVIEGVLSCQCKCCGVVWCGVVWCSVGRSCSSHWLWFVRKRANGV